MLQLGYQASCHSCIGSIHSSGSNNDKPLRMGMRMSSSTSLLLSSTLLSGLSSSHGAFVVVETSEERAANR